MSARISAGDTRVKVSSFTVSRHLKFLGAGVGVVENPATNTFDITITGGASAPASTTAAGIVELATDGEVAAGLAVQANDSRLNNARTPTAHKDSHDSGGTDAFGKADVLAAPSRYIENRADPASDSGAMWINNTSANIEYWDTQGTPIQQTIEIQSAKNANNGYAGLDGSGDVLKANLPGTTVYTDQANSYGDFAQVIRSSRLQLTNPTNTQAYIFAGAAIAADRTITLPLLAADDTLVTLAFAQTLTNKTLTTPIISTISNTGTLTLPTATTTIVGRDTTDTLTNKTIESNNNTIKHSTTNTAGDLLVNNGTKFDRLAVGTGNQQLRVNAGATALEWFTPSSGFTETKGSSQKSGDGSTTAFTIAHGLGATPGWASVHGSSVDAQSEFSYTVDGTNITITFDFPPPTGTNNLTFYWRVAV